MSSLVNSSYKQRIFIYAFSMTQLMSNHFFSWVEAVAERKFYWIGCQRDVNTRMCKSYNVIV